MSVVVFALLSALKVLVLVLVVVLVPLTLLLRLSVLPVEVKPFVWLGQVLMKDDEEENN